MSGDSFDIDWDEDSITIDHHDRDERLSIVRDGDEWVAQISPLDADDEPTKQRIVESQAGAWDCVIEYIDHGAVNDA